MEGVRCKAKLMPEIVALNTGHKICQVVGKVQGERLWITSVFFWGVCGLFPLRVTADKGFPLRVDKK